MDLFLRLNPLLLILLLLILLLLILLLLRLPLDLTVDDWPGSLILLDFNRKLFLSVVSIGAIGDPISRWSHSSIRTVQIQRFWACWEIWALETCDSRSFSFLPHCPWSPSLLLSSFQWHRSRTCRRYSESIKEVQWKYQGETQKPVLKPSKGATAGILLQIEMRRRSSVESCLFVSNLSLSVLAFVRVYHWPLCHSSHLIRNKVSWYNDWNYCPCSEYCFLSLTRWKESKNFGRVAKEATFVEETICGWKTNSWGSKYQKWSITRWKWITIKSWTSCIGSCFEQ